jgi:hypothetical protein
MTDERHGGFRYDGRIYYFNRGEAIQNFGDYLPELFARELLTYAKTEADCYLLIGSVIDPGFLRRARREALGSDYGQLALWGCGARKPATNLGQLRSDLTFLGVRGPLTRDLLGLPASTPLGDSGLLVPLLHRPRASPVTAGKAICIPHVHYQPPTETIRLTGAEVCVSPVIAATESALREIIDKIAGADFVLTASLHGAVLAAAYGRPFAFWDSGAIDAPFKWHDFAASLGFEAMFVSSVSAGRRLYEQQIAPKIRLLPMVPLLEACPFAVRPSVLVDALVADGLVDAESGAAVRAALASLKTEQRDSVSEHHRRSAELRAQAQSLQGYRTRLLARVLSHARAPAKRILSMLPLDLRSQVQKA